MEMQKIGKAEKGKKEAGITSYNEYMNVWDG